MEVLLLLIGAGLLELGVGLIVLGVGFVCLEVGHIVFTYSTKGIKKCGVIMKLHGSLWALEKGGHAGWNT